MLHLYWKKENDLLWAPGTTSICPAGQKDTRPAAGLTSDLPAEEEKEIF